MDVLKLVFLAFALSGCQLSYVIESAYYQADLLNHRVPVSDALKEPSLPQQTKSKLQLAQEAREFSEGHLGLSKTGNYNTYVQLDRPYVTYAVSAAPRSELKSYLWSFPVVGEVPYLGFFREEKAIREAKAMKAKGYDAFVRGVSAFSTLGWFKDPILSSMLQYEDYDLVNTIIHETVHATVFIKSSADFNEQLATYVGNKGSELFYRQKEGLSSPTLARVQLENHDDQLFASFIATEIKNLKEWYASQKGEIPEPVRKERLHDIQTQYLKSLAMRLKTDKYKRFAEGDMNNARLLLYQTYLQDYADFDQAFEKLGRNFQKLIEFCKSLEKEPNPAGALHVFTRG